MIVSKFSLLSCLSPFRLCDSLNKGEIEMLNAASAMVNQSQCDELEGVQLKCLQIVRGRNSESYSRNLVALDLVTLAERRKELILAFTISCFSYSSNQGWSHSFQTGVAWVSC